MHGLGGGRWLALVTRCPTSDPTPVNQPNKAAVAAAEAGEGRAQMEENIVQSHMLPTQSGNRMSQGLDGVRKAARERKQERFTSLLHHLTVDLLRDSFYALKRGASPGVDGVRWSEYESGLEDRLADLHSRIHRGTYRAQLQGGSIYRRPMDGNVRWASRHWKIRSSSRPW
jgi:hypothetical protein